MWVTCVVDVVCAFKQCDSETVIASVASDEAEDNLSARVDTLQPDELTAPSAPSPAVSVDPARAYIDETQAKLARVLSRTDLTPAAKQHHKDED